MAESLAIRRVWERLVVCGTKGGRLAFAPNFSQSMLGASLYSLAFSFRPDEEAALIIRLLGGGD
jgi:hypothetical protein